MDKDFSVDIVYLWCDSSDEKWLENKNRELANYGKKLDSDSTGKCRFINNDELKYSLRSLEKYANWIRNIYIVTASQVPSWLDTTNSRVKVINHEQILPKEVLPTFNAVAIETALHRIPDLSEHFLFANDDMFFGNFVDKDFFFNKGGLPIFRFSKRKIVNKTYRHLYGHMISSAYNMVKKNFGESFAHFPHHNIDSYRKSDLEKCYNAFYNEFEKSAGQKFREWDCVQRSIYEYFAIANGFGVAKITDTYPQRFKSCLTGKGLESMFVELQAKKIKLIDKYQPYLFCLNDSLKTTDKDRMLMRNYLEKKFPIPSSFEKVDDITADIFICYHKDFEFLNNEILTPIQVGADVSGVDLGILKDNSGENISVKNKSFCELTALYWMWKNCKSNYCGLMHYRRLLDLGCGEKRWYNDFSAQIVEQLGLDKAHLTSALQYYDIILPMKRIIPKSKSIYEYYKKKHFISDMDRVLAIIQEKYPQMYECACDVVKNTKDVHLYNMFISSKEFLNGYASWLFDILFTLENEIAKDVLERDSYQQRVYGFLSERLFTVYVEWKKLQGMRVKEVPTAYCEVNKKRYERFQTRTKIYKLLTKIGIRKPHWREQYGV